MVKKSEVVVDALHVVQKEFGTEETLAKPYLSANIELADDFPQRPVALFAVETKDGKTGGDISTTYLVSRIASFCPVDGKRIEIVIFIIEHGKELVHQPVAEPCLRILTNGVVAVPIARGVAGEVIELAERRAGQFHLWLDGLHGVVDATDNVSDIPSAVVFPQFLFPIFRVADIVEMNAIEVIVFR